MDHLRILWVVTRMANKAQNQTKTFDIILLV